MTTQARLRTLASNSAHILLGAASVVSVLLLLTSFLLEYLNPYTSNVPVDPLIVLRPWIRGLAVGVLIWAVVHALRHHRVTPLALVSVALILERWFPWGSPFWAFSNTLASVALAVVLGYLTYPPLRHHYTFARYSGLLVGMVLGVAALAYTAGVSPPLVPPGSSQGWLLGVLFLGPLGAFLGLAAFWVYLYTHRNG